MLFNILVSQAFPHVHEAFQTRAKAHHAAGDLNAAYEDLTAAVRLAPANRDLHRDLLRDTKLNIFTTLCEGLRILKNIQVQFRLKTFFVLTNHN